MKASFSLTVMLLGLAAIVWPDPAAAIPAFARKYDRACTACHSAWPMLNSAGRQFKENGYKFPTDKEKAQVISDFLYWDKYFPASAVLVARPYDKRDSGDEKLRALHEVELMFAGVIYNDVSGFLEIEAEDETDFDPTVEIAAVSYHANKALNVQFAWSPVTFFDPYDTWSHIRRLTRGSYATIDQAFGGADANGRLRFSRQNAALYGRPLDALFYSVGISGVAEDSEGNNPKNLMGRLAFDAMKSATLGLFLLDGEDEATNRAFSRSGVDFQADLLDNRLRVMGAYLKAKDDRATTGEDKNDAWYAQAFYTFKDKEKPTWVPLVRLDSYERANGNDKYDELTLNLGYYFTQNVKGYVEYWKQLDVPAGRVEDNRWTVQLYVAF
jgi:hypothetical protein